MTKNWRVAVIIGILWGLAFYFNQDPPIQSGSSSHKKVEEKPYVHFQAPDFTLTALDGKTYDLKQTKGKPVMINFWASWCGPCNIEAPELSQLYSKYKGKFALYAVNATNTENSLDQVKNFARKYKFQFPVLLDKGGKLSRRYQIKPLPTTFILNDKGQIVDKVIGYGGEGVLEAKLKKELSFEAKR